MSIEVNNTVDFFYLGGVIQGLTQTNHKIAGSISVGLMGFVAAVNLRDRLILHKNTSDLKLALTSLAVEAIQIVSGAITGIGAKTLYRASMQANTKLGTLGVVAVFVGSCLSFGSVFFHKAMQTPALECMP